MNLKLIFFFICFSFSNDPNLLEKDTLLLNKSFSFSENNNSYKIFTNPGYHIINNGEIKTKKNSMIISIDENGKILGYRDLIYNNQKSYILSGTRLENNDFLLTGYTQKRSDEWANILLVRIDENYNSIWMKSFGAMNADDKGYSAVEINQNEFWVLGHTKTTKNGIILLKVDENGNEKWFSFLPKIKCTFANNMVKASNSALFISGTYKNKLFATKVDTNGTQKWYYSYLNDKKIHRAYDIIKTSDDGLLITGNSTGTSINKNFDILLIKLSKKGDEEWIQIFGNESSEVSYAIKETNDMGFIIAGHALVNKQNRTYNSFIIKTNKNGNIEWRKDFTEFSNKLFDIIVDGKYYMALGNKSKYENESDIWIVRVDQNGNTKNINYRN